MGLSLALGLPAGWGDAFAQTTTTRAQPAPSAQKATPTFKPEEIEALVAPIALYPDSVLSQVLMASTYPLEIVHAARWVKANPNVKGDAAVKAVERQALGRQREIAGRVPADPRADERQARLDAEARRRLPRAAEGSARCRAAPARQARRRTGNLKSTEQQKVIVEPPPAGRHAADDRHRAGESGGDLRAGLQPATVVTATGAIRRIRRTTGRRIRPTTRATPSAPASAFGVGLAVGGRDLRQLQLGRRRRRHQRQQGHQHRPQLRSQQGRRAADAGSTTPAIGRVSPIATTRPARSSATASPARTGAAISAVSTVLAVAAAWAASVARWRRRCGVGVGGVGGAVGSVAQAVSVAGAASVALAVSVAVGGVGSAGRSVLAGWRCGSAVRGGGGRRWRGCRPQQCLPGRGRRKRDAARFQPRPIPPLQRSASIGPVEAALRRRWRSGGGGGRGGGGRR